MSTTCVVRLGHVCARHPVLILAAAFAVALACASGIRLIKVTVDPIKLWSSPTSRSRIEKDNYEATFGSFYRIAQIIITAEKGHSLEPLPYVDLLDEEKLFSPLFRREFMLEVLKFQKAVENVTSASGVTFKDVCSQPLAPSSDACNVQTVWAYWQDDQEEFDRSGVNAKSGHNDTYLDHFLICARNPIQSVSIMDFLKKII